MNKKQYGISLGLLGLLTIIIMILGSVLDKFWMFSVFGVVFFLLAFFFLERKKDWFDRDERTKMIEMKASHYTLYTVIILALFASFISGTAEIEVTIGMAFMGIAMFLQLIRIIFWAYFKKKYE